MQSREKLDRDHDRRDHDRDGDRDRESVSFLKWDNLGEGEEGGRDGLKNES